MKRAFQKLKSRGGASLIIALVLALVAVFVGGSVLAAATVNGGRLKNRRASEQAYLLQRSGASLIADQLSQSSLCLTISKKSGSSVTVTAVGGLADGRNDITELFYEAVAVKYLAAQNLLDDVTWTNFKMSGAKPLYYDTVYSLVTDSTKDYQGKFQLSDPAGGAALDTRIKVDVSDRALTNKETYSVYFTFPENPQIRLKVRSTTQFDADEGETKLTWSSPSVIKEGSDN